MGVGDRPLRLRSRKSAESTAQAVLGGQSAALSQGSLGIQVAKALSGSSVNSSTGTVGWSGGTVVEQQSSGAMIWDEVIAHLQARGTYVRSFALQDAGSGDANLSGVVPANVGTTPGSGTGYTISIDSTVKPRGMAGSLCHTIPGPSQEDAVGWYGNWTSDLSDQIGANEEGFVQFRVRFNSDWLDQLIVASTTVGSSLTISTLTVGSPTTVNTSTPHGLSTGDWVIFYGTGMLATRDKIAQVTVLDADTFTVPIDSTGQVFGSGFVSPCSTITGITQASTAVVTTSGAHGLVDNHFVVVRANGMTQVDYRAYRINVLTPNSFQLLGCDSSAYSAFTSGCCARVVPESPKLMVFSAGDTATITESSCTPNDIVVLSDINQQRFPTAYHACGEYQGLYEIGLGSFSYQNEAPGQCIWPATDSTPPPGVPSTCIGMDQPDEWYTFQFGLEYGNQDGAIREVGRTSPPASRPYDYHHCRVRFWVGREDEPQVLVLDVNDSTPVNYWNETGNSDLILRGADNPGGVWHSQSMGKLWLSAFMTNKLFTQVHETLKRYDSQVIFAREFIPDRIDIVDWAPSAGRYNELSGSNTLRGIAGTDPANGKQALVTVLDNWNQTVYAKDVGPYGALIQAGSGHDNFHDAVYAQILDPTAGSCTWSKARNLSTYPGQFTGVDRAGDTTGAINDPTLDRPGPPHTYTNAHFIPASAYGNTKGAYCWPVLLAVGTSGGTIKTYSWFLDLDNAGTGSECVWSVSTNASPGSSDFTGSSGVYDPVRNCIWFLRTGARTTVNKLDIATKTWSEISFTGDVPVTAQELAGGYCPSLDCVVWYWAFGGLQLIVFEPNAGGTGGTMDVGATMTGSAPTTIVGLEWCPHPSVQKFYGLEFNRGASTTYGSAAISNGGGVSAVVVAQAGHGLAEGAKVFLESTGALPAPLTAGNYYFVRYINANTYNLSLTATGALIITTDAGSGLHRVNYAYALGHQARTLTPPASLPGTWAWGVETFTAEGGAGPVGNESVNPRYNGLQWVWAAKSFAWTNTLEGKTNFLRPAAAT
jgi:hypothetical protein